MKSSISKNLDQLVKNIYQSYLDIKTDEFEEIRKEILLDDIKNLYSVVKSLGNKDFEPEVSLEEFAFKNTELIEDESVENSIDTESVNPSIIHEKFEIKEPKPIVEIEQTENKEELLEEIVTSESIHEEILSKTESSESKNEFELEKEINKVPEPIKMKLSSDKIIDFLHLDETPKKEIYDYIDINTRIGLVEIFFKGNSIELSECLMKMNHLSSKEDCIEILNKYATKNEVKPESDIYNTFLNLIERKYKG